MKRKFVVFIIALFAFTAFSLIAVQVVQTNRTVSISNNLFSISVNNAMDDVVDQLNRLRVEDYISQNDRYKLIKFKRIDEINTKMNALVREHSDLFYDETKIQFGTAMQDSASILPGANLTPEEKDAVSQYNKLLNNRFKLTNGDEFYNQFVNELSVFVADNIMNTASFNFPRLDTLIAEKLVENGIDIHPDIAIFGTTNKDVLYTSNEEKLIKFETSPYRYTFHPSGMISSNGYNIVLLFPATELFLRDTLPLYLIISIILILIILVLYFISVRIIVNQRKLDEMKNDFVHNMTHEIKTPIASIGLACEMLQDKSISNDASQVDTFVGMISNENRRMRALVETILQSSKMSDKKFKLNIKEIDIHEILQNVCSSFTLNISTRQGQLLTHFEANPSTLYADDLHITNLVYNLIDNAIKYSPQELFLEISTHREGNNIILSVADHGLGISKEDQKHIFEKFYRVSTGDVHNVKGFGIGLNYVASVVKLHNGTINVESELGKGSKFIVTLPIE